MDGDTQLPIERDCAELRRHQQRARAGLQRSSQHCDCTRMVADIMHGASGGIKSTNVGTWTKFLGKGHAARGARRGDGG